MLSLVQQGASTVSVATHTAGMAELDGDLVLERLDMRARMRFPQQQPRVWVPRKDEVTTEDELRPNVVLFALERTGCEPLYFSVSPVEVRLVKVKR